MSPCTKDLGKIHGIRDAEWFNLKLEKIERDGDKGRNFQPRKTALAFLSLFPVLIEKNSFQFIGVIRLLGSLRKNHATQKTLPGLMK